MTDAAKQWPPVIDLDALKVDDETTGRHFRQLEGACLNALEVRNRLICILSAEEGEWSSSGVVGYAKQYRTLMKLAFEIADNAFTDSEWVVFAMMSHLAKQTGQNEILPW